MSDIELFCIADGSVAQLTGTSVAVEYSTGRTYGGRIDTLGVDENGYPVIIEYKRALNENVINPD